MKKYCEVCDKTIKKNRELNIKIQKHILIILIEKSDLSEEQIKKLNQKFYIKSDKIKKQQSEKIHCEL